MNNIDKEIVFLGTGTSEGVPRVSCLTNDSNCIVCNDAVKPNSKNRRLNNYFFFFFNSRPKSRN